MAVFGVTGKPAEMGIAVVACAIGMAFGNIDKLAKFKGAGFEAEMRKATDDAYATITSLKELAVQSAKSLLLVIAAEGRYGGGLYQTDKLKLKEDIISHLEKMTIDKDSIREVAHGFNRYLLYDLANDTINTINSKTKSIYAGILKDKSDFKTLTYPTPNELKEFILKNNIQDNDIDERIDDFEYFYKNNSLRKPKQVDEH